MKFILSALLLFCSCISLFAGVPVIPMPQSANMTETVFNKNYLLENLIIIKYSDKSGRFYAHQTLSQLAEAEVMYCGVIKDAPRYEWRGLMLDEARHFFGKDQVIKLLDLMARYKMNRLHWHLSDNQGWRVEIKAYPQLATVGGIGCLSNRKAPAKFYTQDEIREIVAYAA